MRGRLHSPFSTDTAPVESPPVAVSMRGLSRGVFLIARFKASLIVGLLLMAGSLLEAQEAARVQPGQIPVQLDPQMAKQVESLRENAKRADTAEDFKMAEKQRLQALALPIPKASKRDTLLEMGHALEEKEKEPIKAAAVYEQILSLDPNDPDAADISLRLGRIYRDLGAYKTALNKFYNVLYAALRAKEGGAYQAIALRAKIEIAHTHFAAGEYAQAAEFYSRLKLIDLPPNERSDVYFRSVYILFLGKDYPGTLRAGKEFLSQYPESPMLPECQYMIVQSLKGLNRQEEALTETLKLLRAGKKYGEQHPEVWAYWQQKTGNEFANELYARGDFLHALTVYQTLAQISDAPEWRWPAIYQIGLCFERLENPDRALEAYNFILKGSLPKTPDSTNDVGLNLTTLREMAQWRSDHLQWLRKNEVQMASLIGATPSAAVPLTSFPAATEAPTSAMPPPAATLAPAATPGAR